MQLSWSSDSRIIPKLGMVELRHHNIKTCLGERLLFMWLRTCGKSVRCIARETGRSPTTVRRWVKRLQTEKYYMKKNIPQQLMARLNYNHLLGNSSSFRYNNNQPICSQSIVNPSNLRSTHLLHMNKFSMAEIDFYNVSPTSCR